MSRLRDKIAVVTGGCSGIGLGTVERFIEEGARVMIADIAVDAGRALAARFGDAAAFHRCDVTQEAQIRVLMDAAVERFGALDVVCNNAGAGGTAATIEEMTGDEWDRTQALLLRSVALGIRYAVPHLKARGGGAIVNTASIAGTQAGAAAVAYSVAKAGVIHLTRVAAAELARDGIRVNAICPGLILTNIFTTADRVPAAAASHVKQQMAQTASDAQPIARPGLPRDAANVIVFLASDEAAFVTGEHVMVDGGLSVGPRHSWDPALRAQRRRDRQEQIEEALRTVDPNKG